jgi:hypothetical protein
MIRSIDWRWSRDMRRCISFNPNFYEAWYGRGSSLDKLPHSAIIYWHLSPSALSTFILQPGDNEPTVFYSYDLAELQAWIAQWDKINTVATNPNAANAKIKVQITFCNVLDQG